MGREIKFRALIHGYMDYFDLRKDQCGDWSNWTSDTIIMQYTGIKDKNGKEIYEGDIVDCYCEIEDKHWRWIPKWSFNRGWEDPDIAIECDVTDFTTELTVMGNVYESLNPDRWE